MANEAVLTCIHFNDFGGLLDLLQSKDISSNHNVTKQQAFHRLALAYGLCHTDLMLTEAVALSEDIWKQWLDTLTIDDYEELDVYIACMYHMIQELGRKLLGGDEWDTQESPSRLPLQQLRERLLSNGHYNNELLFVFRTGNVLYSTQEMISHLLAALKCIEKDRIKDPGLNLRVHDFEASVHVLLADLFGAVQQVEDCKAHLTRATQLFRAIGNQNGCLWVELLFLIHGGKDSYVKMIESLAPQFWEMKDIRGFMRCKMATAEYYQKYQQNLEYHSTITSMFQLICGNSSILSCEPIVTESAVPQCVNRGSALLFWQFYLGMMTHDMEHPQFIGISLELASKCFSVHPKCSIPQLQFALASELSTLYGQKIGDNTKELEWAAIALAKARATEIHEVIVEAQSRFDILLAGRNVIPGEDPYGLYLADWRKAKRTDLQKQFEEAGINKRWEEQFAFANELLVGQLQDEVAKGTEISGEPWLGHAKRILDRLPDNDLRKDRSIMIDLNIAGTVFDSGDAGRTIALLHKTIQELSPGNSFLGMKVSFVLGRAHLQIYRETGNQKHWADSCKLFESISEVAMKQTRPDMAACCHCMLAELWMAHNTGAVPSASQALYHVHKAETLWNTERDGVWNLDGLDGLLARFSLRRRNEGGPVDIFSIAYRACFDMRDYAEAWKWAQRAKARGFAHALDIHKNIDIRGEKSSIIQGNSLIPEPLQGNDIDLDWLLDVCRDQGMVVCIEWITAGDTIYMISKRVGEPPLMYKLEISLSEVEEWYSDFTKAKDDLSDADDAQETLSELQALCEPLKNVIVCRPGELLVLCPTKVISKIPLHALEVDGNILLARNPIVYTHALSILRQCFRRSDKTSEHTGVGDISFFGNPTADTPGGERSVKIIGGAIHAEIFVRAQASKARYMEACHSSKLVHYHGHVIATKKLQGHAMIFGDSLLGVADILAMNLHRYSPFISIVGCGSGSENFSLGDEPLGLVSSFIYAGASTVLATLWPINDELSGEQFSRKFYEQFISSPTGIPRTRRRLDLAKSLQNAALEIRSQEKTRAPYYWAGYVLHGSWIFEA